MRIRRDATRQNHGKAGERGSILIVIALSSTMLIGLTALAIDGSYMYAERNRLFAAADAAAKAGALEVHRNSGATLADLERFADQQVVLHGYSPAGTRCVTAPTGQVDVCIHHPAENGPFAGQAGSVEALVSARTPTFFGRILNWIDAIPGARAVATTANPVNCLVINEDLSIGNHGGPTTPTNGTIVANGCGVAVGGNLIGTNPNSSIVGTPTPDVSVAGIWTTNCGQMGNLTIHAAAPVDPLALLPDFTPDTPPLACGPGPYPPAPAIPTIDPGCYNSISVDTTTMNPGFYYVTGPVHVNNGSLTAHNVMLYLAAPGGMLIVEYNNLLMDFSGITDPTSPWAGIAIFQARANNNQITGGPDGHGGFKEPNKTQIKLDGAIYIPGADVDFKNGLDIIPTGCSIFVAKSFTMKNGNGSFNNNGCTNFAGAAFLSVAMAE